MGRARISLEAVVLLLLVGTLAAVLVFGKNARPPRGEPDRAQVAQIAQLTTYRAGSDDVRIGEPDVFDNLAVYPIFAGAQTDLGPVISLDAALRAGKAEVRENGSGDSALDRHFQGATVGQLVIENKGSVPIYVLAGTIVKGGNQDRQIGQDFIVGSNSAVPVDAFCVEHGRWSSDRDGKQTGGRFAVSGDLATTEVRIAGQYESNQARVWSEVGKVNATNGKQAPTGTLLASLEDETIRSRRSQIAKRISARLDERRPNELLVGIGYVINGKVKGVRWFANHSLYLTFRDVLANTAATDSMAAGADAHTAPPPADTLVRFLEQVDRSKAEERATPAANVNAYRKAPVGASSETKLKANSYEAAKPAPVSRDYVAY